MTRRTLPSIDILEGRALLSGLTYTLTTDRPTYAVGEPVRMTTTVTNDTGQPLPFTIGPGTNDFSVSSGGTTIWDAQSGQPQPQNITTVTLLPGQSYRFAMTWSGQPNEGVASEPTGTLVVRSAAGPASASIAVYTGRAPAAFTPVDPTYNLPNLVIHAPPGPPAAGAQAAALDEASYLYESILGRAADSAGQSAAAAEILAGVPIASIAAGLLRSAEHDAQVVSSDYYGFLGRAGTATEIDAWVADMQSGLTDQQVAAGFLASPEYSALHPTDDGFIASVYVETLGRQPTAAELSAGEGQLASGTRAVLAVGVLTSAEAETDAIEGFYQTILDRQADTAGLSAALSGLRSGAFTLDELAAGLFGSVEHATIEDTV